MNISKFAPKKHKVTSTKVALVDFDGVILKNVNVQNQVAQRVVKYVQETTQSSSYQSAERLNKYMYRRFGHTLLGMTEVYGKEVDFSLKDFNAFVYDGLELQQEDFYAVKSELMEWKVFANKMKQHGIPVYIFSNAPNEWCLKFIDEKDFAGFTLDLVAEPKEMMLKPKRHVYDNLDKKFMGKKIYFIDDKIKNMQRSDWTNILLDPYCLNQWTTVSNGLHVARDLESCGDFITLNK